MTRNKLDSDILIFMNHDFIKLAKYNTIWKFPCYKKGH